MSSTPPSSTAPAHRLERIRGSGYRLLREFDVTFPDGLVGLVGLNGQGKSALLEAIKVALYGGVASKTTVDDLLFTGGSDDAEVELWFVHGDDRYRVKRTMKRKGGADAKLWRNDEPDPVADGTKAVTVEISRVVGAQPEFEIGRFVAQKQLAELSSLEAGVRKHKILKLLGVHQIEEGLKNLRAQRAEFDRTVKARQSILPNIADIDAQIVGLEGELQRIVARIAAAESDVTDAEAAAAAAEVDLAEANRAAEASAAQATTLRLIDESVAGLDEEATLLERRRAELADVDTELAETEARVAAIEAARDELGRLTQAASLREQLPELEAQRRALLREISSVEAQITRLEHLVASLPHLEQRQRDALAQQNAAANAVATAERERDALRAELSALKLDRKKLQTQLEGLSDADAETADCPTCGQALADASGFRAHLTEKLTALETREGQIISAGTEAKRRSEEAGAEQQRLTLELGTIETELAAARAADGELRVARANLEGLRGRLVENDSARASAAALEYDEERHAALATEAAALPALIGLRAELRAAQAEAARVAADVERVASKRAEAGSKRAEAVAAATAAGYDPDAHAAAKQAAADAAAAASQTKVALATLRGEHNVIIERLERYRADRATHGRLTDEINHILRDRGLIELTRETMERLRVSLIGRIRPALERKGSLLLREMSEGRYQTFALDEDYEISVGNGGRLRPVKGLSGGEEDLANLCLRLAISELINEANGVGSTFIVLDEPFGYQDARRRQAITEAIPNLTGHFGQIVLVSHHEDVQAMFPSVIRVDFDPATETSVIFNPERGASATAEPPEPIASARAKRSSKQSVGAAA